MNAPYIHGRRRTFSASAAVEAQNAILTSIKTDDAATWADMGRVLGKSDDRAAAYANTASPIDLNMLTWLNVGSTGNHTPRPPPSSMKTSGHAW